MKRIFTLILVLGALPFSTHAWATCSDLLSAAVVHEPNLRELFQSTEMRELLPLLPKSLLAVTDYLLDRGSSYGEVLRLWGEPAHRKELDTLVTQKALKWLPEEVRSSVRQVIFHENGLLKGLKLQLKPELERYVRKYGFAFMAELGMEELLLIGSLDLISHRAMNDLFQDYLKPLRSAYWLKRLRLEGGWFTSDASRELSKIPALESLTLVNALRVVDQNVFFRDVEKLQSLRSLELSGVEILGDPSPLIHLGSLERLSLIGDRNHLHLEDAQLEVLGRLHRLTHLSLEKVWSAGDAMPSGSGFKRLSHVSLTEVRLSRGWLQFLLSREKIESVAFKYVLLPAAGDPLNFPQWVELIGRSSQLKELRVYYLYPEEFHELLEIFPALESLVVMDEWLLPTRADIEEALRSVRTVSVSAAQRSGVGKVYLQSPKSVYFTLGSASLHQE